MRGCMRVTPARDRERHGGGGECRSSLRRADFHSQLQQVSFRNRRDTSVRVNRNHISLPIRRASVRGLSARELRLIAYSPSGKFRVRPRLEAEGP
jgi:hypothetical protein